MLSKRKEIRKLVSEVHNQVIEGASALVGEGFQVNYKFPGQLIKPGDEVDFTVGGVVSQIANYNTGIYDPSTSTATINRTGRYQYNALVSSGNGLDPWISQYMITIYIDGNPTPYFVFNERILSGQDFGASSSFNLFLHAGAKIQTKISYGMSGSFEGISPDIDVIWGMNLVV